ncbi:MAG: gamma-glutamyl-gamma-aminobutyrate hydrolase family protein [Deltaproteobacteria bacterium]|nr:gamma-glutamyl-gamma-aminobutyrate hydrolase family protein [Deltaproteobacteria bacterium]
MSKILVVEHVPHEGLGIIGQALSGFDLEYMRVYETGEAEASPEGYSALIVMGGPMGVYESDIYPFINGEINLIKEAIKTDVPVLGVCLGSQLLAASAGARVYKGKKKEIGWYNVSLTEEGSSDRLFLGLPDELPVFQWHGDTFDVPVNGVNLASSDLFPHQAIKVGKMAYGFQFHFEVTAKMVGEWIEINEGELKAAKIDPEKIIKETPENIEGLHRFGRAIVQRFARLID